MSVGSVGSSMSDMWQMRVSKDDTNGDSMISMNEFSVATADRQRPEGVSAEDEFANIDGNSDGYITEDEFASFKPERPKPSFEQILGERSRGMVSSTDEMWQEVLSLDDGDSDGSISQDEFLAGLAGMQSTKPAMIIENTLSAEEIFSGIDSDSDSDSDSDGYITESEFSVMEAKAPPPPPPQGGPPPSDSDIEEESVSSYFQTLIDNYMTSYSYTDSIFESSIIA